MSEYIKIDWEKTLILVELDNWNNEDKFLFLFVDYHLPIIRIVSQPLDLSEFLYSRFVYSVDIVLDSKQEYAGYN